MGKNTIIKKAFSQDFINKANKEKNSPSIVHNRGLLSSIPNDQSDISSVIEPERNKEEHEHDTAVEKAQVQNTDIIKDRFSIDGMDQNEIVKTIAQMLTGREDYRDILNRAKDYIYYKEL